jgi:hypothetical protein
LAWTGRSRFPNLLRDGRSRRTRIGRFTVSKSKPVPASTAQYDDIANELSHALAMVRNGPQVRANRLTFSKADCPALAEQVQTLGKVIAGHGLRRALDRLAPGQNRYRPEAVELLRRAADGATAGELVGTLKDYHEGGVLILIRDALPSADEILAAAKLPDTPEWSRPLLRKEVAARLGVTVRALYRHLLAGKYRFKEVSVKLIMVDLRDVPASARERLR